MALEARAARAAGRMAAWRAHAHGPPAAELRLEAARVPPLHAPDHLLVRVRAASLNPIDAAMLGGYGSRVLNALRAAEAACGGGGGGGEGSEFPLVVGRDLVGTVERAGAAARLRPGARVWAALPPHWPGALADYVLVRDAWAGVAPPRMPDAEAGGALYAALSACAALRAAGLGGGGARLGGRRVLLLGLGGAGRAALQVLAARGARVVVGAAGAQAASARDLGAHEALDRHADDYMDRVHASGPYYAVVDCAGLGGEAAGARAWRAARAARWATLTSPVLREADARGLAAGALAAAAGLLRQNRAAAPATVRWAYFTPCAHDVEMLRKMADRGQFSVQVERVFPWWEARAAFERAAAGPAHGKLVLDFTAEPP